MGTTDDVNTILSQTILTFGADPQGCIGWTPRAHVYEVGWAALLEVFGAAQAV